MAFEDLSRCRRGVWDMAPAVALQRRHPGMKAYVTPALPAFSDDGGQALVRFTFGPAHVGWATYLLAWEPGSGRWAVR